MELNILLQCKSNFPSDLTDNSNLTPEEFQKLRDYPLCPSRSDKRRMIVNQLYEPNPELEKLDLPILSWPIEVSSSTFSLTQNWRNFSAEARFLYALGLNRYPSAQTLIQIASKTTNTADQRNRALDFFTTFYHTYEYNRTDFSNVKEAFLPSQPVDGKVYLCNPSDIYSNPSCSVLGFYILDRRFLADASKFTVKSDPTPQSLEKAILKNPPSTTTEAREKFTYLAQRITTFTKSQLITLSRSKIVPVTKNGVVTHVSPSLCFIDTHVVTKEKVWEDIFDFVDFGDRANLFLEALGVKDTPDAIQIADQLSREAKRIYQAMDIAGYLRLLSMLGGNVTALQRDKMLWTRLKTATFLIGLATTIAEDSSTKTIATLARAEDIVIVDEPRLGVIFRDKLVVAPERDDCETLYMALGAPHLSSLVRQKYTHRGSPTTNSATETLQKHIIERAGIFLTLPEIAPQVKKSSFLSDNLRIYAYDSLQVERSLIFGRIRASDTEKVTAIVDTSVKGCLLLVTDPQNVSWNQVAEALNGVVLKKTNRGMDLLFETILKENLQFLRFRGFAVDRLLNRHLEEQRLAKAKREAEEQERRKEEKLRQEKAKLEEERMVREVQEHEMNGALVNGHINQQIKDNGKGNIPGSWQEDGPQVNGEPPAYTPPPRSRNPLVTLPSHRPNGFMNSIKNVLGLPDPLLPERPPPIPGGPPPVPERPPQPTHPGSVSHVATSKSSIENQLTSAIRAVRPFNQNSLFSPASSAMVHDAPQSYCDSTAEQDLTSYSNSPPWGLETFYISSGKGLFESMLSEREADIHFFAGLLKLLAQVYKVRVDSFHLFFDPQKRTIAFNRKGSLFFNISYTSFSKTRCLMEDIIWNYMLKMMDIQKTHRYSPRWGRSLTDSRYTGLRLLHMNWRIT